MAIPYGFHEGNRSEYMAAFALSNLGFCTPVPRQEDMFFVDFIVHLAHLQEGLFVPSGRCLAVQVKSDFEPLRFDTTRKARCLSGLTIPYFLGVVSKEEETLRVFSTLTRLCHMWKFGRDVQVELAAGVEGEPVPMPDWDNHRVPLGGPIVKVDLGQLDDPDTKKDVRRRFHDVMCYWVKLEEAALAWKEHGVPLVLWQTHHVTNEVPDQRKQTFWLAANPLSFGAITQAVLHDLLSYSYYITTTIERGDKGELPLGAETVNTLRDLACVVKRLGTVSKEAVGGLDRDLAGAQ